MPFSCRTVVEGGIGDPTTILPCGSTFQATLIPFITDIEAESRENFSREIKMKAITRIS